MDSRHEYPSFAWSNSRDDAFQSCERRYSHLGWSTDADVPKERRLTYRLKQLTSLHATLGSAVHALCQERVETIRQGGRWLGGVAAVEARLQESLQQVCIASRDRDGFLRRPKGHGMLQSVYYRDRFDANEVRAVKRKVGSCARHLVKHPIWRELGSLPPNAFQAIERLDSFGVGGISVWIKADLIYMDGDRVTVQDWKTRADDEYPTTPQVALYALYARDRLGLSFREGCWMGRIVNMVNGMDQCVRLTADNLARAEARIHESASRMKESTLDEATSQPLPKEHFPLINSELRQRCTYCAYLGLCKSELKAGTQPQRARPLTEGTGGGA
jgi:hypothetical protein